MSIGKMKACQAAANRATGSSPSQGDWIEISTRQLESIWAIQGAPELASAGERHIVERSISTSGNRSDRRGRPGTTFIGAMRHEERFGASYQHATGWVGVFSQEQMMLARILYVEGCREGTAGSSHIALHAMHLNHSGVSTIIGGPTEICEVRVFGFVIEPSNPERLCRQ
jgi:hypothetical protein